MSDVIKSVGKHLLLWVPDFGSSEFPTVDDQGVAGFEQRTMTSFLRLGAASPTWETEPGGDLLELVPQTGQPGDPRLDKLQDLEAKAVAAVTAGKPADAAVLRAKATELATKWGLTIPAGGVVGNRDVPFIDDVRDRDPGNPGHGLNPAQRQAESAKLFSRGGWRDHSDGNRISTTYGDKVEVVRGNYKMVVLGRQSDPGEGMGWDVDGSHLNDFAPGTMPGASVYQEFLEDYVIKTKDVDGEDVELKGVWLLVNSTENVYQYSRNAGNFRVENWGDLIEEYTGSENPERVSTKSSAGMQGHPGDDHSYGPGTAARGARCPWAALTTGRVRSNPHKISKTWATKIEEYTGSEAWRIPSIHGETWATKTYEKTDVKETVEGHTVVGGTVTETTTIGGAHNETTTVTGNTLSVTTVGVAQMEITGVAGAIIGVTGSPVNIDIATHVIQVELSAIGVKASFGVAGIDIDISFAGLRIEGAFSGKAIDLAEDRTELDFILTQVATSKNTINTISTVLSTVEKEISTHKTQINTLYDAKAGLVLLA